MNDRPLPDPQRPPSDADIRRWFDVAAPPMAPPSERVESDLHAVRARSGAIRRRRAWAGGTAAALLVVGGAALTLGRGTDDSSTLIDVATFAESDPDGVPDTAPDTAPIDDSAPDDSVDEPTAPDTTAVNDDEAADDDRPVDVGPGGDEPSSDGDGVDDFPVPDVSEWAELPWLDADGNIDWEAFVEEQQALFERWAAELERWFDEHPDFGADIDLEDWLDPATLDEWTTKLDEWTATFDDQAFDLDELFHSEGGDFAWPDVTILDGRIELDLDGDGTIDKTVDWELPDFDGLELPEEFEQWIDEWGDADDLPDISIPDISIPDLDLSDLDLSDLDLTDLDDLQLPAEFDQLIDDLLGAGD